MRTHSSRWQTSEKYSPYTFKQGANDMTNRTAESKKGRHQRTQNLRDDIAETQRLNLVGLEFLMGIIEDLSLIHI